MKYWGRLVVEVFQKDPSYYQWIMDADLPLTTKQIATRIRLRSINSQK